MSLQELMGGCVFTAVNATSDTLTFKDDDGFEVTFYHSQECCESVSIEDITGDLNDLVGVPIVVAEERSDGTLEKLSELQIPAAHLDADLTAWTFYTFRTIKGTVDVRWFGSSNGYYSVSVNVVVKHPDRDPTASRISLFDIFQETTGW